MHHNRPRILAHASALILLFSACGGTTDARDESGAGGSGPGEASGAGAPGPSGPGPSATGGGGGRARVEPALLLGVMVHLETKMAWQDPAFFTQYIDRIRKDYLPVLAAQGARFTWEVRGELTAMIEEQNDPILDELLAAGQGVGVHADKGFPESTQTTFTAELSGLRAGLLALVPEVRHVSGICSGLDWVSAALDAGYASATGNVAYCVMSLPEAERPPEYASCKSPVTCHDTFPAAIDERIHPWRAADGASWLTPSATGLLILPASGGLVCASEEQFGKAGNCTHTSEDTKLFFQDLEAALAARDPARPGAHYLGWSYGALLDVGELEAWLAELAPYVADGRVKWATFAEMQDSYVAWETGK
jgi:hypothetical protein